MNTELTIGGDPFREWTTPDGEEWVAGAPWMIVISRQLKREGVEKPTMSEISARVAEYQPGNPPPVELCEEMLDVDARQREKGYDGP
jgi:hypothetical protein